MALTKVKLISDGVIVQGNLHSSHGITTAHIAEGTSSDSGLYYTNARVDSRITAASTSDLSEGSNLYYTDARADARVALIVDSSPATLNTLNELAAALGDDPNFATTTATSIGTKLPLAGGTLTGALLIQQSSTSTGFTTEKTGGTGSFINLKDTAGSVFIGGVNSEFVIQTPSGSYSNKLTISNSGNISSLGSEFYFGTANSVSSFLRLGGENAAGGRLYIQYSGDSSYIDSYGGHGSTERYRDLAINARNLIFKTGAANSVTEKFRIDSSGNSTFAGDVGIGGSPTNPSYGTFNQKIDMKGSVDSLILMRGTTASTEYGLYSYNSDFIISRTNINGWWNAPDFKLNSGNATFAGTLTVNGSGGSVFNSTSASNHIIAAYRATNGNNVATFRTTDSGHIFRIHAQNAGSIYIQNDDGSNYIKIPDSGSNEVAGNSTFAGTVSTTGTIRSCSHLEVSGQLRLLDSTCSTARSHWAYDDAANQSYFWNHEADAFTSFYTNNLERLRITSGGVVTVGAGSGNGSRFNVIGDTTTSIGYNQMNIANAVGNWGMLLGFGNGQATGNYHGLNHAAIINVESAPLHLGTSNSAVLTILANGDVGMGTLLPQRALHIVADQGRAIIQLDKGTDKIISIGTGSSATGADDTIMQMFNEGTEKIRIFTEGSSFFNGGNVGIGVTGPSAKLHVMGTTGLPATSGTTFTGTMRLGVSGGYGTVMDFGAVGPSTGTQWIQVTDSSNQALHYPLLLQPNGGNVGIGTTVPVAKLDIVEVSGASAFNQSNNGVKIGRIQYGWYTGVSYGNGTAFVHIKTNLWMGGTHTNSEGNANNTQYIMGGFVINSFGYGGLNGQGSVKFHNWSGGFPGLVVSNTGNWGTFVQNPYTSTDGYCVIVLRHNHYSTPNIDFHQSYTGYTWRQVSVTAQAQSSSATGVY